MKNLSLSTLVLLVFMLTSCGFGCIDGTGEIVTENVQLETFEAISLDIAANVEVIQAKESKVVVTTYENVLEELTFEVHRNDLEISSESCVSTDKDIQIKVYTPELEHVTINGSGYLFSEGNLTGKNFTLTINGSGDVHLNTKMESVTCKINGSGDIRLAGQADLFEVKINGSGEVNATQLQATNKTIKINGSGDVHLSDCNNLQTSINGSGDVDCDSDKN